MYLNRALIIGNLTRDPEFKTLPSGTPVCAFSIATNRVWKDKNGQKQENTEYHNIVVFGRQAETSSQYLKKGQNVLVEGRLQTRSWDGKDGTKKYRTEIVADRVQFGPKAGASGSSKTSSKEDKESGGGGEEGIDYPDEEINPDDIPF
jgi:single-strand DNA-binding protein